MKQKIVKCEKANDDEGKQRNYFPGTAWLAPPHLCPELCGTEVIYMRGVYFNGQIYMNGSFILEL